MVKHVENLMDVLYELHCNDENFLESRLMVSIYWDDETGLTDIVLLDKDKWKYYTLFTFDKYSFNELKQVRFMVNNLYTHYGFMGSYAVMNEIDLKMLELTL